MSTQHTTRKDYAVWTPPYERVTVPAAWAEYEHMRDAGKHPLSVGDKVRHKLTNMKGTVTNVGTDDDGHWAHIKHSDGQTRIHGHAYVKGLEVS